MSELRDECYKCLNNQNCLSMADYGSFYCMTRRKFKMPEHEDNKEIIERYYTANEECIPKQKVKDILNEIQEEYDKVQEQFDCIWDKKSKDNYDRYKLQELSAMQQELGFILGKFEELLEEGD